MADDDLKALLLQLIERIDRTVATKDDIARIEGTMAKDIARIERTMATKEQVAALRAEHGERLQRLEDGQERIEAELADLRRATDIAELRSRVTEISARMPVLVGVAETGTKP